MPHLRAALLLIAASARPALAEPSQGSRTSLSSLLSRLFARAVALEDNAGKGVESNEDRPLSLLDAARSSGPVAGGADAEDDEEEGGTASALLQVGAQARFGQGNSAFHGVSTSFFEDEDAPVTNNKLRSLAPARPLQAFAPNDVGRGAVPALHPLEGPPLANSSGGGVLLQYAEATSQAVEPKRPGFFADEDEQQGPLVSVPSGADGMQVDALSLADDSNEDASGRHSNEDAVTTAQDKRQRVWHESKATQEAKQEVGAFSSKAAEEKQEEIQMELEMERNRRKEQERAGEEDKAKQKAEEQETLNKTELDKQKAKATKAEFAKGIRAHSIELSASQVEPAQTSASDAKRKQRAAEALAFFEAQGDMGGQEADEEAASQVPSQPVDEPDEVLYPYAPEVEGPEKTLKLSLLAEQQHEIAPTALLARDAPALQEEIAEQDTMSSDARPPKREATEHRADEHGATEHKTAEREAATDKAAKFESAKLQTLVREDGSQLADDMEARHNPDFHEERRVHADQEDAQLAAALEENARLVSQLAAVQRERVAPAAVPVVLDQNVLPAALLPSSSTDRAAPVGTGVVLEQSLLGTGSDRVGRRGEAATAPAIFGPEHGSCTPKCTWRCESPRCDEVCEPECEAPRCETRCAGIDTSGCAMECQEPHCAVTCPNTTCPSAGCPSCTTACSEPMCKLKCSNDQPCRNVCENPNCRWKCRAPEECPAPKCEMACEAPRDCMGGTFQELPPLQPGETAVQSFAAPASALQAAAGASPPRVLRGGSQSPNTVLVQLMTMPGGVGTDGSAHAVQQSAMALPVMLPGYHSR